MVIDKQHYREMVNIIINGTGYYEKLDKDPQKYTRQKYNKYLKNYKNHLTRKELDYLENFEVKQLNFMVYRKYITVK